MTNYLLGGGGGAATAVAYWPIICLKSRRLIAGEAENLIDSPELRCERTGGARLGLAGTN